MHNNIEKIVNKNEHRSQTHVGHMSNTLDLEVSKNKSSVFQFIKIQNIKSTHNTCLSA